MNCTIDSLEMLAPQAASNDTKTLVATTNVAMRMKCQTSEKKEPMSLLCLVSDGNTESLRSVVHGVRDRQREMERECDSYPMCTNKSVTV